MVALDANRAPFPIFREYLWTMFSVVGAGKGFAARPGRVGRTGGPQSQDWRWSAEARCARPAVDALRRSSRVYTTAIDWIVYFRSGG